MIIYVAGPYTARDDEGHEANVNRAIEQALGVIERGHIPFIPHLTHYVDLRAEKKYGERLPWQLYMFVDDALLGRCDALYKYAPSKGADIEEARARELGMPIYHRLSDIPDLGSLVDYAVREYRHQPPDVALIPVPEAFLKD